MLEDFGQLLGSRRERRVRIVGYGEAAGVFVRLHARTLGTLDDLHIGRRVIRRGEVLVNLDDHEDVMHRFASEPNALRGTQQIAYVIGTEKVPELQLVRDRIGDSLADVWPLRKFDRQGVARYRQATEQFADALDARYGRNTGMGVIREFVRRAADPVTARGQWNSPRLAMILGGAGLRVERNLNALGRVEGAALAAYRGLTVYHGSIERLFAMSNRVAGQALAAKPFRACGSQPSHRATYMRNFQQAAADNRLLVVRPYGDHACAQNARDFDEAALAIEEGEVATAARALRRVQRAYELFLIHRMTENLLARLSFDMRRGLRFDLLVLNGYHQGLLQIHVALDDGLDDDLRRPTAFRVRRDLEESRELLVIAAGRPDALGDLKSAVGRAARRF